MRPVSNRIKAMQSLDSRLFGHGVYSFSSATVHTACNSASQRKRGGEHGAAERTAVRS